MESAREYDTIAAHTSVIDGFTYMGKRMGGYDRLARHGSDLRLFGVMGTGMERYPSWPRFKLGWRLMIVQFGIMILSFLEERYIFCGWGEMGRECKV